MRNQRSDLGLQLSGAWHGDRTRLISRTLYDHSGGFGNALTDFLVGNISFVMERCMLLNLRKLVAAARI